MLRTLRRLTPDEADPRILALALDHGLATRLTSLVAVDKTPSRPEGARLTRADLPLNLPAGWEFDKVFGQDRAPAQPKPVTDERRAAADEITRVASTAGIAHASKPTPVARAQGGVPLPKTATDGELRMMLGFILMLASGLLLAWRRRARASH